VTANAIFHSKIRHIMAKNYYPQYNIGSVKYVLNFHDGEKSHDDGSPFYDIRTFKNKVKFNSAIKSLQNSGYVLHR
jgi:hypothetical protein